MMTDNTPLGKLIRWRLMMCLRLPILGNEAHFDMQDIKKLDEIIDDLKEILLVSKENIQLVGSKEVKKQ